MLDAPEPSGEDGDSVAGQAREWKIAVEQAENVAKRAAKLPAGVTRSLEQSEAAGGLAVAALRLVRDSSV